MDADEHLIGGLEKRGRVYWLRKRVPAEFASVEGRKEVNVSLKTRDRKEAECKFKERWEGLLSRWRAELVRLTNPGTRAEFDASKDLLKQMDLPWCRLDDLVSGPLEEILIRLERIEGEPADSLAVSAALGLVHLPGTMMSEMPAEFERIHEADLAATNPRQHRQWGNKFRRTAKTFAISVGPRAMLKITDQDASLYADHWEKRRNAGVSTHYANKHLNYAEQMVDAYYTDLGFRNGYHNPFRDLRLEETAAEKLTEVGTKLPLPEDWIDDVLFDPVKMAGLDEEAYAITLIDAELGTRGTEITDLPPDAIRLDAPIPHILITNVLEGEHRRKIKNTASTRAMPLMGWSLEMFRKYPNGFVNHRGKDRYSGEVNGYFRENGLFPEHDEDPTQHYTIGGLRHSMEDRMLDAGFTNEERACILGHSVKSLRGRPVYGSKMPLHLRALLMEKIARATPTWAPRSHEEIDAAIDELLDTERKRQRRSRTARLV